MPAFSARSLFRLLSAVGAFRNNRTGSVSIVTALSLTVLVGSVGLGVEASYWLTAQRSLQNAADSAVIAAATNGGANYATEARAVTAQYGYADGANNVSVTTSNSATCPNGATNCYRVTISMQAPLYLAPVVGFNGTTAADGSHVIGISASALAGPGSTPREYCILALATSGSEGFRTNGNPKADLAGCNIMSNTSATCNGHNTNADIGDAHTSNNGCGNVQHSNVPIVADPYGGLASNIPTDPCASYPQEPSKKQDPALPSSNLWGGSSTLSGNVNVCGDLQLTGNLTINAPSNATLIIRNGRLDLNGYTLQSAPGSGLTVVFAGSNGSYTHAPTGSGTIDIAAPSTGAWKGVAIYQAPTLTTGVDISAAGNSPAWNITGLVYLPHSSVTFSGIVNKASNGHSCFGLVVDNITVNGTGKILDRGECGASGLTLPTGNIPGGRGQLVG